MKISFVVFGLGFWALAAIQHLWLGDFFGRLPADYVSETRYAAKCRSHQSPTSLAEEYESVIRRRDQTLSTGFDHAIIQGDMHWLTPSGVSIFEILNLYGVDRRTRRNLRGYGNQERFGQFLFPPHVSKRKYDVWDPLYVGPRVATFHHEESVEGLPVYVFSFVVDGIDETVGYSSLPDVPEKYRATTYAKGRICVEPNSGIVVDYEETGVSHFVDPKTGEHAGEILEWSDHYTRDTRAAQLRLATREMWRMFALERGLPGALLLTGLVFAASGFQRKKNLLPARAPAGLLEIVR